MKKKTMAHAATSVARSPLWLAVPAVLVLACVSTAVAQYEPLVFDASLYEVEESETSMEILDAAAIEEANLEAALAAAAESGAGTTTTASASSVGELADGTWTGYAACGEGNEDDWSPYYVAVTIEVEDGAVTGILSIKGTSTGDDGDATLNWKSSENQEYLDWAISGRTVGSISLTGVKTQLNTFIAQGSNPTSIDVVTGATYSSEAIFEAYYDALSKAAAAAGSTVETVELDDVSSIADGGGSSAATVDSDADVSTLADGTWTGYAACGVGNEDDWSPYYVAVTITIENGVVTGIVSIEGSTTGDEGDEDLNWDADENEKYLTWAIDGRTKGGVDYEGVLAQLEAFIASGETPSSVDTVSGATYSSTAIFQAYYAALVKAAEAAGSALELSDDSDDDASDDDAASDDASDDSGSDDDDDAIDADGVTTLADGTWTGYAACGVDNDDEWSPYYVAVTLTIEDGSVTSIDSIVGTSTSEDDDEELNWDADENQAYLNWATDGRTKGGVEYTGLLAQLEAAIEAGGIATSIDAVSGATYSSDAIFQAYYAALVKAAAAAGSTLDMGDDDDATSDDDAGDDDATSDDDATGDEDDSDDDVSDDDDDTSDNDDDADDDSDSDSDIELIDGTYLGAAFCQDEDDPSAWSAYYVIVKITVEGGAITEITSIYGDSQGVIDSAYIYSNTENGTYLNRAIAGTLKKTGVKKQIQNCLDAGEEVTDIDAISGATWSSEAIVNAYTAAAELAWETAVAAAEGSDDAEADSSVVLIKIYGDDGLYATMEATTDEDEEE